MRRFSAIRHANPLHRRAYDAARKFADGLAEHHAFEAAASIAFWFFLSVVPLLVLAGFLIGRVARSRGVDALIEPVLDLAPGGAEGLVRKELERLAGASATTIAPVSAVGYMWTASSGLHNLMDVFETGLKARRRRPWWKQRAIAICWVLLGLAATCGLAWTIVHIDAAIHAPEPAAAPPLAPASAAPPSVPAASASAHPNDRARPQPAAAAKGRGAIRHRVKKALDTPGERVIAGALLLVVGMLFLAGFYRFAVEHPPGVRRRVWPGTCTAVAFWMLVSWGFGAYVVSIADYALYYGSLATVAVLLVWLYLTSLSLVVGAEVNVQMEGVRDPSSLRSSG